MALLCNRSILYQYDYDVSTLGRNCNHSKINDVIFFHYILLLKNIGTKLADLFAVSFSDFAAHQNNIE
jgi:hypothetical protein